MRARKLIVALDVDEPARAKSIVVRLGGAADFYKVPPSLVLRDSSLIPWLRRRRKKVFFDGKWHDIPSQVKRSVEAAGRLGVTACSVHVGAGRDALKAALAARPRPRVWGITVLTSFGDGDLRETGVASSVEAQVLRLAGLADEVGLDGLVCSPWEAAAIRRRSSLALVTPGVSWGGVRGNDQRRLASPGEAWRNGADYLVVGRGVLQSPDPRRAVREILKEGIP